MVVSSCVTILSLVDLLLESANDRVSGSMKMCSRVKRTRTSRGKFIILVMNLFKAVVIDALVVLCFKRRMILKILNGAEYSIPECETLVLYTLTISHEINAHCFDTTRLLNCSLYSIIEASTH